MIDDKTPIEDTTVAEVTLTNMISEHRADGDSRWYAELWVALPDGTTQRISLKAGDTMKLQMPTRVFLEIDNEVRSTRGLHKCCESSTR